MTLGPGGTSLYFTKVGGFLPTELWTSDGTAGGTMSLATVAPVFAVRPDGLAAAGSYLFFVAHDTAHGYELWRTDGTVGGTLRLTDLAPGTESITCSLLDTAELGGRLFFTLAPDGVQGSELHVSDGTVAGTQKVIDLHAGHSAPGGYTVFNGQMWFRAKGPTGNLELFRTDGTAAGTVQVTDLAATGASIDPATLPAIFAGDLYFAAEDAAGGNELWRLGGATGTYGPVADLEPGAGDALPEYLTALGTSRLVFAATTAADGRELFATDGTAAGTGLVADLSGSPTEDSLPEHLHRVGASHVLVNATGTTGSRDLYRHDPAGGLQLLATDLFLHGGPVAELWTGTELVSLFAAMTPGTGVELYRSDGTAGGTTLVADIHPWFFDSLPTELHAHQASGQVLFQATDGVHGRELWASDGTAAGTHLVLDLNPAASGLPDGFTDVAGGVVFAADDGTAGRELWFTDGTTASTTLLKDLNPGPDPSDPEGLTAVGGLVVFAADDGVHGRELFVTDGTAAGTVLLTDLMPGDANPRLFAPFGDQVYFAADHPLSGPVVYRTDLTAAGTVLFANLDLWNHFPIHELQPVAGGLFVTFNKTLHFVDHASSATELTSYSSQIDPPTNLVPVGGGVVFSADDPWADGVTSLFHSDGTVAGTLPLCPGPEGDLSNFGKLLPFGDQLYLTMDVPGMGVELASLTAPGAQTHDLGIGGELVHLEADPPVLGGLLELRGWGGPAGAVSLLGFSVGSPGPGAGPLLPGHASWIHPASAVVLGPVPTTPWSLTVPLPNLPILAGLSLAAQTWHLPAGAFPASTSNGLQLVLGS